jgi:hypothetical protein
LTCCLFVFEDIDGALDGVLFLPENPVLFLGVEIGFGGFLADFYDCWDYLAVSDFELPKVLDNVNHLK